MEQHPIPQNISSYQFRLIGDMTLRQFFLLLLGGGLAFLFYITNLPGLIKWFFMFISILVGVAFAFLPLEGRPLDKWLVAFIKTIYNPTRFYWKKISTMPEYLQDEKVVKLPTPSTPPTRTMTNAPLPQFDPIEKIAEFIDESEKTKINQINSLFDQNENTENNTISQNGSFQKTIDTNNQINIKHIDTQKIIPKRILNTTNPSSLNISPKQTPSTNQPQPTSGVITLQPPGNDQKIQVATLNQNLPFPELPETPNTLVGMVVDHFGKIIENSIIEIKTSEGTVRATKTNRLGQFFLATPLKNDSYTIEVEKPGFQFKPISMKLEGKIYPPIEIRAIN